MELTSDIDVRRAYARDASGLEMVPEVVARPASVADVVDVIAEATAARAAGDRRRRPDEHDGRVDHAIAASCSRCARWVASSTSIRGARVRASSPACSIGALKKSCASHGLRFAPDPTSEEE